MIMDNIATQLTQLQTIKQDIATAIEGKGGTVGEGFDTYATAISNIPSGGGGTPQIRLSENPDLKFGYSTFSSVPNYIIVDALPPYIFHQCTALTSVTISNPSSVTTIGEYAFCDCYSLSSVTIPNSVTSIGDYAFSACYILSSVNIPNSVASIGNYAFNSCYRLTSATIPNSVTTIGEGAFVDCTSLTSLTIPNSVTSIGHNAFSGCTSLTSVIIPRTPYLFGAISDENGNNTLTSYTFCRCTSLTSVTIPGELINLVYNMFEGCDHLTSVVIEEGIELLPDFIFNGCVSLTSVTIPSTVKYLHDYAFNSCQGLQWIKCLPLTPPEHWETHLWGHDPHYAFEDTNDCPIYVPDAALTAYTSSQYWSNYWSRIKPMSDFATDFPNA